MPGNASTLQTVTSLTPKEAASRLIRASKSDQDWLDRFSRQLDQQRGGQSLARVLQVWGLSQSEAAQLFGVSRQALSKWLQQGIPAERSAAVADLAAATDILVHHLKRDRIPAVVRRAAPALDDQSMIELVALEHTDTLLASCRAMFDFSRAHA
ncbi:MAG: hypothetical protein AAF004_09415 [Pseudomonadota bacterium]